MNYNQQITDLISTRQDVRATAGRVDVLLKKTLGRDLHVGRLVDIYIDKRDEKRYLCALVI